MGEDTYRVVIAGCAGSGVSTLANYLGETLTGVEIREVTIGIGTPCAPVQADAIVYVSTAYPREEDRRAVSGLREGGRDGRAKPRLLGVLARADLLEWTPGSPQAVSAAAARPHADLAGLALTIGVVPVSALLARASRSLTMSDMESLRRMASSRADQGRARLGEVWWYSAGLFTERAVSIERSQRERLLGLLDLPGIGLAVSALRDSPEMTLDEMGELMRETSGIAVIDTWVRDSLWDAAAARAGGARISLERRIVQELAAGRGRAAAGIRMLRRSALLGVPWAAERVAAGAITRSSVLEWAAVARREAASARTSHQAHAALARYRHLLAVAENIMTDGDAA
ncbi:hypothetical protein [Hoyosella subflava]|uniref:Uncharacterized protein n=1 Tax=Hoyosella subflava (strain DSM 45089 / JCM 17490 / NBRC 109087 / DQS3-9A1) TaxID=443218 RepID=F6EJF2_HOYSD|nr:hypothetical protein [Hoyosella subflava]AEF42568.1 hypothetical protein AS9A_4134 [Hoyosella subflava DQS3-9A1]